MGSEPSTANYATKLAATKFTKLTTKFGTKLATKFGTKLATKLTTKLTTKSGTKFTAKSGTKFNQMIETTLSAKRVAMGHGRAKTGGDEEKYDGSSNTYDTKQPGCLGKDTNTSWNLEIPGGGRAKIQHNESHENN